METKEKQLPLLTLGDLWRILHKCWQRMLLVALAVCLGLFVGNRLLPPRYASTATLYILRQDSSGQQLSEDFSLALNVVSDCGHLLKSHSVLNEVIDTLGLDTTYQELRMCITTHNPENTRILEVTAQADDPTKAKEIVDAICDIGTAKIGKAMGFAQVNLYEYGVWDHNPCNRVTALHCALAFALTALAVYGWELLRFLLNPEQKEKVKTVVTVAKVVINRK